MILNFQLKLEEIMKISVFRFLVWRDSDDLKYTTLAHNMFSPPSDYNPVGDACVLRWEHLTTMGMLEFGGQAVRGSPRVSVLNPEKHHPIRHGVGYIGRGCQYVRG